MRAARVLGACFAASLLGCMGAIGDAPPSPPAAVDPPLPIILKSSAYRALSNHEYRRTLSMLLGREVPASMFANWQPSTTYSGFDGIMWSGFSSKATQDRIALMDALVDSVVASPRVTICEPDGTDDCATRIIRSFTSRAYRRPVTDAELAELMATYRAAYAFAAATAPSPRDQFNEGLRVTLGGVLMSPQLLVRVEPAPAAGERDLDAYELASRLAFFMTAGPPDDELWALAEDGSILDVDTLQAQAMRLLSTRTQDFIDSFMGQLYDFRTLDGAPADTLQGAFYRESSLVFAEIIARDLPATTVLHPGFTYVNQLLAENYGISASIGFDDSFKRVETDKRGGILQQGSMLSITSTPVKTSPTRRGRWVQGRVLCKTIPPPGPELFEEIAAVSAGIPATATVKQRVDSHRSAGAACTGCHQYMDPIGLGLESFDMQGRTRGYYDQAGMVPVETDSEFLCTPFETFDELNALIASNEDVGPCVAEKVVLYGLGQLLTDSDQGLIAAVAAKVDDHDPSFADLVTRLVTSAPFRRITQAPTSTP